MASTWHRLVVYWGVRRDPDLEARWQAGRPDARTTLIGLPLGVVVLVAVFGAIVWVVRLVGGGNTSVASVASGGVRLLWALAVVAAAVRGLAWVRRRRDR